MARNAFANFATESPMRAESGPGLACGMPSASLSALSSARRSFAARPRFSTAPAGRGWRFRCGSSAAGSSWCGAVCYAELATTYPRDGGDYEYLNRAFGRWCGFLFAWTQITYIISGNIAIMAYAFADYALRLRPAWDKSSLWLTLGPIVVLSALNVLGVVAGKVTQNVLTVAKVVGLGGLVVAGLFFAGGDAKPDAVVANKGEAQSRSRACIRSLRLRRLGPCGLRRGRGSRSAAQSCPGHSCWALSASRSFISL